MSKTLKMRLIRGGCVVVALFIFYMIFCGIVGNKKFYPNTSINGINVGKMTVQEAAQAVEAQFVTEYNNAHIDVTLNENVYHVKITDALNMDVTDAVTQAFRANHKFFGRGINYIKSLFVDQKYTATPSLKDKNLLYTAVKNSGIVVTSSIEDKAYELTDTSLVVTKGRGGYVVDEEKLVLQLEEVITAGTYDVVLECPLTYGDVNLEDIYNTIYTEPSDATLDPENDYAVVASVRGISFDLDAAEALLAAAADGEEVQIPLIFKEPNLSTEELEACLFRDRLSTFSTNVGGTSNRKANVELAAKNCNDTILLPGEEFSFNNVVGERTIANGFQAAPSYVNGESVDEVGGGICQVSSTLYDACLYANLLISERHCHPYVSSYVGAGFDATVSWGGPDYRFVNNTDYPIKIKASYADSVVTCSIYGTITEEFTVELTSETVGTEAYKTVYEDDDTMEVGEEEVSVSGITGRSIQTYRKVYDGAGNLISSEAESLSKYSRRDEVVLVGTKEPEETTEEAETEEVTTEEPATKEPATEEPTTAAPAQTPTTEEPEKTENKAE